MSTQPTPEQLPTQPLDPPVDEPLPTARRTVRVGAIVWGVVVIVCGVVALAVAGGADVDGGALAIGILAGAGLALVVGSVLTATRRKR